MIFTNPLVIVGLGMVVLSCVSYVLNRDGSSLAAINTYGRIYKGSTTFHKVGEVNGKHVQNRVEKWEE